MSFTHVIYSLQIFSLNRFNTYVLISGIWLALNTVLIYYILKEDHSFTFEHHYRYQVDPSALGHKLTFADESIPLWNSVQDARYRTELNQIARKSKSMALLFKRANTYFPEIEKILREEKVPVDFKYFALVESGLEHTKSTKKAGGFWQLMPVTARFLGLEVSQEVDNRYHLEKSTRAAARLLKLYKRQFGTWSNAAAAYNIGPEKLKHLRAEQRENSFYNLQINEETSRFFFKILAYKTIFNQPKAYGFLPIGRYGRYVNQTIEVKVTAPLLSLSKFAAMHGVTKEAIQEANPWLLGNHLLDASPDRPYTLRVPSPARYTEVASTNIRENLQ